MRKMIISGILAALLFCVPALAETVPVTETEIASLVERIQDLASQSEVLNDPTADDAVSEDGTAYQYDFGVLYRDGEDDRVSAILVMDAEIEGPRGVRIDWSVNQVMDAFPCDNPELRGSREEAVLYLEGSAEDGFRYGLVERDGQRIRVMEYGAVDPAKESRAALTLQISGDGVDAIFVSGLNGTFSREDAADLYRELEEKKSVNWYSRVPQSLNGAELEIFGEADLDFSELSYLTAVPEMFGDNVEDVLIDNDDGTWLRRVDGDGFEAVFSCDSEGRNAFPLSYTILSPDLEGPRAVRLGDLFHEDFNRFRNGEGEVDESGMTEVLYGTPGTAPYGLAEYGNGAEMTLRYVTPTLGGPDVELRLRYEDTVLTEIILHTLGGDE